MPRERPSSATGLPVLDLSELGFWAGYRAWLRFHRGRLWIVGATLVVLFLVVLFASQTPQDPFSYELF